jgi:hypothetical protein
MPGSISFAKMRGRLPQVSGVDSYSGGSYLRSVPCRVGVPTMSRRKPKAVAWEIIKLKASPAKLIRIVYADEETSVRKIAVERLRLRPCDVQRILVRRV